MSALADSATDAVATALLRAREEIPSGTDTPVPDELARHCIGAIDATGLVEHIEYWAVQDARGPGGAPERFPKKALLVAMLVCARTNRPMLATEWTRILFKGFSPRIREHLGISNLEAPVRSSEWLAAYRCVRHRFHAIERLLDFSELPRNRRLAPKAFDERRRPLSAEKLTRRRDRQTWLINKVIQASLKGLPSPVWEQWTGGLAVDSTPVKTFARHPHRTGLGKDRRVVTHSADPDAGWYLREGDHGDIDSLPDGSTPRRMLYGYEHSLVFMTPVSKAEKHLYPKLLLAMAPPHRPGTDPAGHAIAALAEVAALTPRRGLVAGDLAYTQARPESFALPLRALGYQPVIDYKSDQLGVQGSHHGALLIDGRLYCPAMPQSLVVATARHRRGEIDEPTWQRRLHERRAYELRPKATPDADGNVRMLCPAAGTAPTLRCQLKRSSLSRAHAAKTRVSLNHLLQSNPPKICQQQSITVPTEVHDRFGQPLRHGTEEWRSAYRLMRSINEGGNGVAKDPAFEDLATAGRRRILGQAANALITCMLHYATNMRLILSFLQEAEVGDDDVARRNGRSRRPRASVVTYLPHPATGDPPP